MVRILSVIAMLVAVNCWGVTYTELVTNGDFSSPPVSYGGAPTSWFGVADAKIYYDVPIDAHLWYLNSATKGQDAWQAVSLTAGAGYVIAADLKGWTTAGHLSAYATAIVQLSWFNDGLYQWEYYAPSHIEFTGTTPEDIYTWHHVSAYFYIPPGTYFGMFGPYITLNGDTNDNGYVAYRWDNVSLLIPEPATLSLLGLGGLTLLRRRRSA
jgi:hypothetical protein